MANTGYKYDASWTTLINAQVLTQGGTITFTSVNPIPLDQKASCLISVTATYSNHAKATAGLTVALLRDIDGTNWETVTVIPWGFEMPFTQNATERKGFCLSAADLLNPKIYLAWGNTTSGSSVTVTVAYKLSDIPAAS